MEFFISAPLGVTFSSFSPESCELEFLRMLRLSCNQLAASAKPLRKPTKYLRSCNQTAREDCADAIALMSDRAWQVALALLRWRPNVEPSSAGL